jgi:rhomboid protease GluP
VSEDAGAPRRDEAHGAGAEAEADATAASEAAKGLHGAPVSSLLLAVNVGVFVAQVLLSRSARALLEVPNHTLLLLGANASQWTIADNRFETLVTSVFLHGSLLHLGFNLLVLWQVGPFLERAVGPARFLPLYLGAGVVGSALSAIGGRFLGPAISVGASGAVCGLLGALLVVAVRTQGLRGPLTKQMAAWLAFLFLVPALGYVLKGRDMGGMVQVDNAAHVGGTLAGGIIAATWQRGFSYGRRAQLAILATSALIVVASGIVVSVRNRTDPYVFMDVEDRTRAALEHLRAGRCADATTAMRRAMQMDPRNRAIRALSDQIDRECMSELGPAFAPGPLPPARR